MAENVIFERPQNSSTPPPPQESHIPPDPFTNASSLIPPQSAAPPIQVQPASSVPAAAGTEIPKPSPAGIAPALSIPPVPPGEGGIFSSPFLKIGIGIAGGIIVLLLLIFLIGKLTHLRGGGGKVTLTYWGLWESESVMQPVIADFERKYPNITVVYSKEDAQHYTERLITRIPAGSGPDIFRYHNTWLPMVHTLLLPLSNDVITKSDFQKNYYPVVQADLVRNGAIYGIPLEIDTLSLFVNQRIFQAAGYAVPTTWVSFQDIARKLTVKDENNKIKTAGAALGTFDNITHAPDIISLLLRQNNVDPKHMSATPGSAKFAADALTFYTLFASSDQNTWDTTLDPSKIAFAKENLAMYFGYSWDVFDIKALNPTLNFMIYPVPHVSAAQPLTVASYWVEGVSAKTKHPSEALLFMNYLAQKETEQKIFTEESKTRLFGEPYARVDLAESLKDNSYLKPIIAQAKNAQPLVFAGETQDTTGISAQLNGYLGNAIRGGQGGISADSSIKTLSDGIAQILQQYGE